MESDADIYSDVVSTYVRVIKQDSPEAADVVEAIRSASGSRAALRATLVITLMKMEAQRNHSLKDIRIERELLGAFPAALPLLDRAVAYWLRDWEAARTEVRRLA